jgi:hypothetical protein
MMVDYLKATVRFSATVQADKNKFTIMPFMFYDDKNNAGKGTGYVFHNGFDNFTLNLTLWELKNFHVLNTGKVDNNLYYGQGYVTGKASFTGPFDNMDIRISAKTAPGTSIAIPIREGDAYALPNYIHFKTAKKRVVKKKEDFPIRSLVMDIEATNDAKIDIIFDELMNERISGNGYGKIRFEMNKSADFYMFGTYYVSSGDYLFTAFDIYNKPFSIRPGGTITWHGDPLDAKLNLVAYTEVTADPKNLLTAVKTSATTTEDAITQPITAQSELYIKGNLFSPEISFGLNFPRVQLEYPNANVTLMPVIARIKADKEETARQVFSLLLMQQFLVPTFAEGESGIDNAGTTALSAAGTDLLSAQMSNWLNKIDPNWKVNVIYRNGSITLPNEYGVGLKRKFFNNKLGFDGSISNYSNKPNINLEYQVTKKGNVRVKAYTRSGFNVVNTSSLNTPITTNGVGIVYTTEFNRFWKRKSKEIKKVKDTPVMKNDSPQVVNDTLQKTIVPPLGQHQDKGRRENRNNNVFILRESMYADLTKKEHHPGRKK